MPASIILTADDYAIAPGVSRAIRELAAAGRLSATSAMTNMPHWRQEARALRPFRDRLAIGLHLDLTAGSPLGPMTTLAPDGRFRGLNALLGLALTLRIDRAEVREEIVRQLDAFEAGLGAPPDHVDGHQHVHAVPMISSELVAILAARYRGQRPLVRVPMASRDALLALGTAGIKGAFVGVMATWLGWRARKAGLPVNDAFGGFSSFTVGRPYEWELKAAMEDPAVARGRRPIVMCHPGFPDEELARLDPIGARRREEHDALASIHHLPELIWHVHRSADGAPVDWSGAVAT